MENNNKIIFWVIGIIFIIIGFLFNSVRANNQKIDAMENGVYDTRVDISAMRTDINWIKATLIDLKELTLK